MGQLRRHSELDTDLKVEKSWMNSCQEQEILYFRIDFGTHLFFCFLGNGCSFVGNEVRKYS